MLVVERRSTGQRISGDEPTLLWTVALAPTRPILSHISTGAVAAPVAGVHAFRVNGAVSAQRADRKP